MKTYRNANQQSGDVTFCAHIPQHHKVKQCPSPRSFGVPSGGRFTFDDIAINGSTITDSCVAVGLTSVGAP